MHQKAIILARIDTELLNLFEAMQAAQSQDEYLTVLRLAYMQGYQKAFEEGFPGEFLESLTRD